LESVQIDPSKIECIPTSYRYGHTGTNFSPGTLNKTTYVYNSTKANAIIIDTLPFNSPVNILTEYPEFFLVCSPKAKSGYIKKTELYLHSLFWGYKSCTYLFGISKYGTNDNTDCNRSTLKVVKVNDKNKIVYFYNDSIMGKNYKIKLIHNSALKNSEAVFYLSYHCYSEIGVVADHFIVDNGNELSRLILTSGSGDGGSSDISTVYLPVRLTNGKKIVLAKNGVLSVDETTAKVETYPYPTNCGIPIEELIVVENKSVEDQWNEEKGEKVYNKDGTEALDISNIETIYYQWTGKIIKRVKNIRSK
jgi:hypothetical protein